MRWTTGRATPAQQALKGQWLPVAGRVAVCASLLCAQQVREAGDRVAEEQEEEEEEEAVAEKVTTDEAAAAAVKEAAAVEESSRRRHCSS